MSIPSPTSGESREDYISRCMSAQQNESKPQDQKLAICFSHWRDRSKSDLAKSIVFAAQRMTHG